LPSRTGVPPVFACPGRSGRGGTNGVAFVSVVVIFLGLVAQWLAQATVHCQGFLKVAFQVSWRGVLPRHLRPGQVCRSNPHIRRGDCFDRPRTPVSQ